MHDKANKLINRYKFLTPLLLGKIILGGIILILRTDGTLGKMNSYRDVVCGLLCLDFKCDSSVSLPEINK